MTYRTSKRAMSRAIPTPLMPPTRKNTVVASEIADTSHPRSLLIALR